MLRKILHNLTNYGWYTLIGLVMAVCGVDLLTNEHYFFWPPQFVSLMNDDRIDVIVIIVGVGLILYAMFGIHSNAIISILLGLAAAIGALIAFAFYIHMVYARQAMLSIPLVLALFFVAVVLKVALNRNTRND